MIAYAVVNEAAQGHAIDRTVRSLQAQNAALQQQIDERRTQIGEADDTAWLEEQARRLGFVFPGESLYIITTPGSALPATGGVNAALPTYSPATPSPASSPGVASPGASPGATAKPSPTPLVFVMPTPSPSPH